MEEKPSHITLRIFRESPQIVNLELGAGCGNFGERYYPICFLSDAKTPYKLKEDCPDGPFATITCKATEIPCPDSRFSKVIMCNPYNFGFRDSEDGGSLLKELGRVLKADGEVVIISSDRNPYGAVANVRRRVEEFQNEMCKFEVEERRIDAAVEYPGYSFRRMDHTITVPTRLIKLKCKK